MTCKWCAFSTKQQYLLKWKKHSCVWFVFTKYLLQVWPEQAANLIWGSLQFLDESSNNTTKLVIKDSSAVPSSSLSIKCLGLWDWVAVVVGQHTTFTPLNIEAVCSSEMSAPTSYSTQCHNLNHNINLYSCKSLKSISTAMWLLQASHKVISDQGINYCEWDYNVFP